MSAGLRFHFRDIDPFQNDILSDINRTYTEDIQKIHNFLLVLMHSLRPNSSWVLTNKM